MSNFSLLDTLNGSRWDTSANNINTVGYVSCNGGTAVGTYYSNNVSAFRVPTGPTSSRPSPGLVGYLRFNTDSCYNCLEYYDPLSALWTPIYPIPGITSVTPDYVTDGSGASGYYNTNPLIISGYGYVPGCTVSYRGIDSSVYAAPSTTYVSSTQIKATVPASVYNGYNQDPFTIVVTNPTGVSGFLLNALDVDPSASWVTPAGLLTNSLGGTTLDSSFVLTTSSSPYFRVQAIDLEGNAVTYNSPDISSNSVTRNLSITTSGGYGYITGTAYSLTNATVSFTINALDGRQVTPRSFSLNVNAAIRTATVTSGGGYAYQITYTDAAGQNPTSSGPYANGYTVYTFNPNAITQTLAPIPQTSNDSYQNAEASYTFTPNFSSNTVEVLVVGGGGLGAGDTYTATGNGGGGGGGYYSNIGGAGLTISSGTSYTIKVGAGGYAGATAVAANRRGGAGSSIIGGVISQSVGGGGGGGYWSGELGQNGGTNGGSGGGGAGNAFGGAATGGKGNNGAAGTGPGGGGGGAQAAGSVSSGGSGQSNSISGNSVIYAGGGGGSGGGAAGSGGGSAGAPTGTSGASVAAMTPAVGTDGLGGGSGAQVGNGLPAGSGGVAGYVSRGGSGVVIIRFKSYSG
jgi:hypothetical protein